MKKYTIVLLIALMCFMLAGCDTNNDKDISIDQYKLYINNTEYWNISTFNGYKCIEKNTNKDDNGIYTVTFKFKSLK